MKKISSIFVLMTAFYINAIAQSEAIKFNNTIAIGPNDSKEQIIAKASHVVPTPNQLRALKNEFIAFIHFGPNTFTRKEWGSGMENPKIFDLKELHTDQWCQTIKNAGMKMVIITVKHHDGFVLWQSRYTKHGIMSSGFQNGKGDILKDLAKSCKKYGLKLGIYMSPADLFQIESPTGLYGNLSETTKRTIPRAIEGRPFANQAKFQFELDDYNEYFLNQLFEVLTEYGPIDEVWFDGAHPKRKGNQQYNYLAWKELIHTLAPKAVIFGKEDVRWCGNESGATRATEWNIIPYPENPNTANHFPDLTDHSLGGREELYKGKFLHYQQAETNTSIREGWFYRDDVKQRVRSADDVFDIYERSVGGNSTFLLNVPPNREGKLSAPDVNVLQEVGKRITETYGVNLFSGIKLENDNFVINTGKPVKINRIIIQEDIANYGERVEEHLVEAWIANKWQKIASASNIGYKRILRFPGVTASKFRLVVTTSRAKPVIANISAHYYRERPPQLAFFRNRDGLLSISPKGEDFNWNPHGQNAAANLNKDITIYYTTDGTIPTITSKIYVAPIYLAKGEVKAIAINQDEKGPLAVAIYGIVKKNWQTSESDKAAIDANLQTYTKSLKHEIVIALDSACSLSGFVYTPPKQFSEGMMEQGVIEISKDGRNWERIENFVFGNLINDPTARTHYFKKEVLAKYVKVQATAIAGDKKWLAIAELDFLVK